MRFKIFIDGSVKRFQPPGGWEFDFLKSNTKKWVLAAKTGTHFFM